MKFNVTVAEVVGIEASDAATALAAVQVQYNAMHGYDEKRHYKVIPVI